METAKFKLETKIPDTMETAKFKLETKEDERTGCCRMRCAHIVCHMRKRSTTTRQHK